MTSVDARAHALVAGIAWQGLVLPVAMRTWPQNTRMPEGVWRGAVTGILNDVHDALPPALRAHVTVVADRAYGCGPVFDAVSSLGWSLVVRIQGQARVRLPDRTVLRVRDLAPHPGARWVGEGAVVAPGPGAPPASFPLDDGTAWETPSSGTGSSRGTPLVAVFKKAGWRPTHVVALWPSGHDEPLLLVTTDRPDADALDAYARRWGIERTIAAWKSRGWGMERTGVTCPARLRRLLALQAVATWWVLATAAAAAAAILARLARRQRRRATASPASPGRTGRTGRTGRPGRLTPAMASARADGWLVPPRTHDPQGGRRPHVNPAPHVGTHRLGCPLLVRPVPRRHRLPTLTRTVFGRRPSPDLGEGAGG